MSKFMDNVWENCTFSDEIISGNLQEHKFAVELHEFLIEEADPVYQNPEQFFNNTYLTDQMKSILKQTLLHIDRNEGSPIIVINTGFGGGKTHTILLLHHVFSNPSLGFQYISKFNLNQENRLGKIPYTKVVTIDCRDIKKHTLWGEIAHRLGKYDQFREFDESQKPINNLDDLKNLFAEPTLLMLDELPLYLLESANQKVGDVYLHTLTIAFLTKLISVVSGRPNCCLIITLTEVQQLYAEYTKKIKDDIKRIEDFHAQEITSSLGEAMSRQSITVTPVEKSQIYDVVKTRLVRNIVDEKIRDKIVDEYYNFYKEKGFVLEPNYKETMIKSYPFHPFLIDTLYDRVRTIPDFNQTRGMLRLLGYVLRDIYESKIDCKLVSTTDIHLDNPKIADELTSKIGIKLQHVIESDCIKHAKQLDAQKHFKVVEAIARTIFLYSLHKETRKSGIKTSQIKLAVCKPDTDPGIISQTLEDDIDKNFWYIQSKELQEFYFVEQPNINKIINENASEVTENDVREEIFKTLTGLLKGSKLSPIIWDEHELEDTKNLKIFAIDYKINASADITSYVSKNLEYLSNDKIRENQNTIVFVYVDPDAVRSLEDKARWLNAIKKSRSDERVKATKEFVDKINSRQSDANADLIKECFSAYSKVAYPDGSQPRLCEIYRLDTSSETIHDAVLEVLGKQGKLIDKLSIDGITDITEPKTISQIFNSFKQNKSKKFLLDDKSIFEAIKESISESRYGYAKDLAESDGKYEAEIGNNVSPSWEGYLVPKDVIIPGTLKASTSLSQPDELQILHKYRLSCTDVQTIISNISSLAILKTFDDSIQQTIHADLNLDGTTIKIDGNLKNYNRIKSILESIKSSTTGDGYLTITSKVDLIDSLNKCKIKFEEI